MYTTTITKKIEFFVQLCFYAAALIPLIVAQNSAIFPFVFPKVVYFEVVAGLALVGMVALWVLQPASRPRRGWFVATISVYATFLFVSAIQGFDPSRSFWSNHERMTGVVFIWFAMLFGLMVASFYAMRPERLKYFLYYLCGVSMVVSMTGVVQAFDSKFLLAMSERMAGTLGNPIYLGGFTALFLLLNAYFLWIERKTAWVWYFVAGVILNGAGLYLSSTRGAVISLFAAAVVGLAWYAPRMWHGGHRRAFVGAVCAVVAALFISFILVRTGVIDDSSKFARLFGARGFTTTFSTRVIAWKIAYDGFRERPFFGWGPENFFYVFNKHYNPKSLLFGSYETWFDHAHNTPLDILVTQGAVGLALFLALYVVVWWHALRTKHASVTDELLTVTLVLLFVMHFVQNLFVFDHPVSYVYFYLFFGVLVARQWASNPLPARAETMRTYPAWLAVGQGALTLFVGYLTIPSLRVNNLDFQAQVNARAGGDLRVTQQLFQQARDIGGSHYTDVLLDIGRVTQQFVYPENIKERWQFYQYGIAAVDELVTKYEPYNLIAVLLQGQNLTTAVIAGNGAYVPRADQMFKRALELSPRRQQTLYSWGRLKFLLGKNDEGMKLIQQAIDLEPNVSTSHWYMALFASGVDNKRAVAELDLAIKLGEEIKGSTEELTTASIFARGGEYVRSMEYYEFALKNTKAPDWTPRVVRDAYDHAGKATRLDIQKKIRDAFPAALEASVTKKK